MGLSRGRTEPRSVRSTATIHSFVDEDTNSGAPSGIGVLAHTSFLSRLRCCCVTIYPITCHPLRPGTTP